MVQIVTSVALVDLRVCLVLKQDSHRFGVAVWTHDGQLQRCVAVELMRQWTCLDRLDILLLGRWELNLSLQARHVEEVLQHFILAVERCGANNSADDRVLALLGKADVSNIGGFAARFCQHVEDWNVASGCSLHDVR